MTARQLGYEAVRQVHHWPWKIGGGALVTIASTAALARFGIGIPYLAFASWTVLYSVTGWWAWRRLLMPVSTKEWLTRRDEWMARNQGTASWVDILEAAGVGAMRRRAVVMRPSLRGLSRWALHRVPVTAYAVDLVKVGWFTVHSPAEMWTLRLGGPRMGKTGSLANHVIDAPGAVVVTSTRPDLLDLTGPLRSGKGAIHVFNPSLYGGYASTVRWSLLVDCAEYATCQRRASDLIPESQGEGARWDTQARRLLAMLLHAAAISNRTVFDVVGWIAHANPETGKEVAEHLRESPSALALMNEARQTFTTNVNTLSSITTTLMASLAWVADERAASIGDAPLDHPDLLDVEGLVRGGCDSLYLISPAERGVLAALTGALTAEIAFHARLVAGEMPSGRLDPPLTMCLDEAALACNGIPLDQWTADMGGRGVSGHIAAQSLSQMRGLWGETGADTILTNCGSVLVFGGVKGSVDLEKLSTLTGRRLMQVDSDDRRFVEVLAPAEIASLPEGRALIVRAMMPPAVGDVPFRVWDRKDVKAAAGRWSPQKVDRRDIPTRTAFIVPDTIEELGSTS